MPLNKETKPTLKCLTFVFSSYFCFLAIVVQFIVLFYLLLFIVTVISLHLLFFIKYSRRCIDVSMLSSILASPLPPSSLDTYSLSISSLWDGRPYASS